jgi:hypothetical protein
LIGADQRIGARREEWSVFCFGLLVCLFVFYIFLCFILPTTQNNINAGDLNQ